MILPVSFHFLQILLVLDDILTFLRYFKSSFLSLKENQKIIFQELCRCSSFSFLSTKLQIPVKGFLLEVVFSLTTEGNRK